MLENIQDFDEKFRHHRPQHDKSMMKRAMCISTLRVSWNLIEAEICHNPGTGAQSLNSPYHTHLRLLMPAVAHWGGYVVHSPS